MYYVFSKSTEKLTGKCECLSEQAIRTSRGISQLLPSLNNAKGNPTRTCDNCNLEQKMMCKIYKLPKAYLVLCNFKFDLSGFERCT